MIAATETVISFHPPKQSYSILSLFIIHAAWYVRYYQMQVVHKEFGQILYCPYYVYTQCDTFEIISYCLTQDAGGTQEVGQILYCPYYSYTQHDIFDIIWYNITYKQRRWYTRSLVLYYIVHITYTLNVTCSILHNIVQCVNIYVIYTLTHFMIYVIYTLYVILHISSYRNAGGTQGVWSAGSHWQGADQVIFMHNVSQCDVKILFRI
jgi:hypothetical protein